MTVSPTSLRRQPTPTRTLLVAGAVVLVLAALVTALLVTGVLDTSSSGPVGSGVSAVDERAVEPFRRLELAGSNEVSIEVGAPRSVVVSADDNLLDRVTTEVERGELVVDTEGSFTTAAPMTVVVTVPTLDGLELSGSGAITAEGVRGSFLAVTLSGSGLVSAAGRVNILDVTLSGSGNVGLDRLRTMDARAELTGSGRIVVNVTGTLDASIDGSGTITYLGNPLELQQQVTGSGAVVQG